MDNIYRIKFSDFYVKAIVFGSNTENGDVELQIIPAFIKDEAGWFPKDKANWYCDQLKKQFQNDKYGYEISLEKVEVKYEQ